MNDPGAGSARSDLLPEYRQIQDLLLDAETLVRAVASGRQRNTMVPFRRVELRYVDLKAGRRLQVTSYDERQASTRNVVPGTPVEGVLSELLATPYANWSVTTMTETLQLRVSKKGKLLMHRDTHGGDAREEPDRIHDRVKSRRLAASDPVFGLLGITTADGTVKPSRTSKFRQVQDLLAAVDPLVDQAVALGPGADLSAERPLRVVDLGCGNAYLTFAAFRYLTTVRELPVSALGIDVKAQARAHNSEIARQLGVDDRLRFVQATIETAAVERTPDLVMALHACDTATDDALARAVTWQTPVVVAAPCCHHDIARQLGAVTEPPEYRLLTRHGILKERFADVLTDALRAAILRIAGYRVEVVEFVDSKHTPRNALIRAVRTGAPPDDATVDAYRSLVSSWGVQPALAVRLGRVDPELRDRLDPG
ncbi:MAG: class I SAM-dependent methyltransferase [Nocardioidaceae bacterium]